MIDYLILFDYVFLTMFTTMLISVYRTLFTVIAIAALTAIWGCDNSFDPVNTDNTIYSVHGMLDLLEESSYIRVRNMNSPFTLEATEQLDVNVTLDNLNSGESRQLRSSIREYRGVYLHTFSYDEKVLPDTRYLFRVENSSGVQVEMDVLTPTLPVPKITRDNHACTTPVNLAFEPMNGGTITLRFGLELDTEDSDGWWGRIITFGPSEYEERVSITFTPLRTAQGIARSFGTCFAMLPDKNIYVAIAHYSPGFYEQINSDVTDILETTRRFGGFYADTLAIPVDISK